jgi:hypothetical protein
MMKTTIVSIMLLLFVGCAYNSGTVQIAKKSYLQFSGNIEGVSVIIDENDAFSLSLEKDPLYQLNPGKHTLKIFRNSNLIVDRVIFLEDQGTMEILIP